MFSRCVILALFFATACTSADPEPPADTDDETTEGSGSTDDTGSTDSGSIDTSSDGADEESTGTPSCPEGTFADGDDCWPCAVGPGTYREQTIEVEGEARYFYLHIPDAYTCDDPWPVLVDLHGSATGIAEEAYGLEAAKATADAEGFMLLRPRSRSSSQGGTEVFRWDQNSGDSERNRVFLEQLVATLAQSAHLDRDRIYVMGFSSGTNQTAVAAADSEGEFDGFGFIGGGSWTINAIAKPGARFYLHTGYRDYMHRYTRELQGHLGAAGVDADAIFERKSDGGHELDPWIYPELWAFLDRGERPPEGEPVHAIEVELPGPADILAMERAGEAVLVTTAQGDLWRGEAGRWAAVDIAGSAGGDDVLGDLCVAEDGSAIAVGGHVKAESPDGLSWAYDTTLGWPSNAGMGLNHFNAVACGSTQFAVGDWMAYIRDDRGWSAVAMDGGGYTAQGASVTTAPWGTTLASGYYGYLGRSVDPPVGFVKRPLPVYPAWIYDTAAVESEVWVAVGQEGTILRSDDDGVSWSVAMPSADTDWYAVAAGPAGRVIAVGRGCAIAVSEDAGATWTDASCGLDGYLAAAVWVSEDEALVGGEDGVILRVVAP